MKRILLMKKIEENGEFDIFRDVPSDKIYDVIKRVSNGGCPNWGNKLWFQAIYSEIVTGEHEVSLWTDEGPEEINEKYDLVVYPMANIFAEQYVAGMKYLTDIFNKIHIPIYIVACGAQADSYEKIDDLVQAIGETARKFIESVYQSGGEFALRGYITKTFMDRVCTNTAVVTGCPSLYQMGRNLKISNVKVERSKFLPITNGRLPMVKKILMKSPNSVYIDQDLYFDCLYKPNYMKNGSLREDIIFATYFDKYAATLLAQRRIFMFANMFDWYGYIKTSGVNYSIGSRIHGNIMPLLAGVPATVLGADSRTREMAEFFDIPCVVPDKGRSYTIEEAYDLYLQADYTKFNENFAQRYDVFEGFLRRCGIVSKVNENNEFLNRNLTDFRFDLCSVNDEAFAKAEKRMRRKAVLLWAGEKVLKIRTIFG